MFLGSSWRCDGRLSSSDVYRNTSVYIHERMSLIGVRDRVFFEAPKRAGLDSFLVRRLLKRPRTSKSEDTKRRRKTKQKKKGF